MSTLYMTDVTERSVGTSLKKNQIIPNPLLLFCVDLSALKFLITAMRPNWYVLKLPQIIKDSDKYWAKGA